MRETWEPCSSSGLQRSPGLVTFVLESDFCSKERLFIWLLKSLLDSLLGPHLKFNPRHMFISEWRQYLVTSIQTYGEGLQQLLHRCPSELLGNDLVLFPEKGKHVTVLDEIYEQQWFFIRVYLWGRKNNFCCDRGKLSERKETKRPDT